MPSPFTLPLLSLSLVGAAMVGAHLGESAIGMINPIHFQGPALHPRDRGVAIAEPLPAPPRPVPYHQLYGWSQGNAQLASVCDDCPTAFTAETYDQAAMPYRREERSAWVQPAAAFVAEEERKARRPDIDRYAHFVVSEAPDEAEAPAEETVEQAVQLVLAEPVTNEPEAENSPGLY